MVGLRRRWGAGGRPRCGRAGRAARDGGKPTSTQGRGLPRIRRRGPCGMALVPADRKGAGLPGARVSGAPRTTCGDVRAHGWSRRGVVDGPREAAAVARSRPLRIKAAGLGADATSFGRQPAEGRDRQVARAQVARAAARRADARRRRGREGRDLPCCASSRQAGSACLIASSDAGRLQPCATARS